MVLNIEAHEEDKAWWPNLPMMEACLAGYLDPKAGSFTSPKSVHWFGYHTDDWIYRAATQYANAILPVKLAHDISEAKELRTGVEKSRPWPSPSEGLRGSPW